MSIMLSMKNLVLGGAVAVVTACTSASTTHAATALSILRPQLIAALNECTRTHGYDPEQTSGVAENTLAPNELPWRQCAYDAVRAYAKENPSLGDLYSQLISEDMAMTTAIQQGSLTRSQRRARIETLLGQIRAAEDAQTQAAAKQGSGGQNPALLHQGRNQLDRVAEGLQGLH
jgi:hypothetical protein